jgi:hypothetical protein
MFQTTNQYIIDTLPSSEQHESQFCHLSSRLLVQKIVQKPHQILLGLVPNGFGSKLGPQKWMVNLQRPWQLSGLEDG